MLKTIEQWRTQLEERHFRRRVRKALALHKRGGVWRDRLSLNHFQHHQNRLQTEWRAREVHSWDRDRPATHVAQLFAEQCLKDAEAALERLFARLSEIDVIDFTMRDPNSGAILLSGAVMRSEVMNLRAPSSGMRLKQLGVTYRLQNWRFEPLG